MFKNYIKIALRNLGKDKVHTAINVFGLAVGLACCLLIGLFVRHEWSYDAFHADADRIFRVWGLEDYGENQEFFYSVTPLPLGATLETTFPEVEATVRVGTFTDLVQRNDKAFSETIHYVDAPFFEVFSFGLRQGEASTVLADPASVVLTPEVARRYFGEANPVGETLTINVAGEPLEFTVSGLAEAPPAASNIQYQMVIPAEVTRRLFSERALQSWTNIFVETYVLLAEGTTAAALEAKMPTMMQQVLGERYGTYEHTFGFQAITDIHLNPEIPVGLQPTSDPAYSYILGAIALFVLLIAAINFITLSIGRSADRALEVGVRKAIGAGRRQLMLQFWGEAALLTLLALVLGVVLAEVFLPLFNTLSGRSLTLSLDGATLALIAGLGVFIAVAAGSYPAALLSSFRPAEVLKGSLSVPGDRGLLRRGLVVVQFALSIFLIASTLIMSRQLDFLQTKNLGFDKEQVVVIPTDVPIEEGAMLAERLRGELSGHDAVVGMTASAFPLNGGWVEIGYTTDDEVYRTFHANIVDEDFLETMRISLAAGRDFSRDNPADARSALIVNRAFVEAYGWDDALGQRLPGRNFPPHEIIGVVEDFSFASLRSAVEPAALVLSMDVLRPGVENIEFPSSPRLDLSVRLASNETAGALALLETTWATVAPGRDFSFYFLDDAVDSQYREEARLGRIVGIASLLAILIACLGLFGLAALTVLRRTKEIGIRKVMGAGVPSLVMLLTKDFSLLVGLAFVVAAPLAYLAMNRWLSDFAFRIDLGVGTFLLAGAAALAIAWLTVSYQSIKAALSDPVKSLRYE